MMELRKKCQNLRITENMLFHAVFACLIGEYNGLSEAFYATVISNRDNTATDHTVTMLCRTVPVYLKAKTDMLKTEEFIKTLRDAIYNAGTGGFMSFSNICIKNGIKVPTIAMIYRERPVDEELIPGWRQEELESFSSVENLMVKIFYHSDGSLFLNFDASLYFSPEEIKTMAERLDEIICGL